MSDLREAIQWLPKAELHVHLDGSILPQTLIELAEVQGLRPVAPREDLVAAALGADGKFDDLQAYLDAFAHTLAVMQTEPALRRIAQELIESAARDGVHHIEVRFCPDLHARKGLSGDAVLQAVLTGLREGERRLAVSFGVIVTALRNLSPADSLRLAELAVAWSDRGVVGFDLAGPEEGNSSEPHRRAFETAAGGGLGVTIHAGEVSGPETVTHALDCGANRIGHGTQLRRDPAVLERVKSEQIPLESCPTSNVQTHAVTGYDDHPLMDYHRQGLPVTVNTDSRLVSLTSVTDEMMHLHEHQGMTWDEAIELCKASFRAAFLDAARKEELVGRVDTVVEKAIAAGFNPATLTVETSAD